MGNVINTNVSSLAAQNQSTRTSGLVSDSLTKLSTGMRINKAADNAAGLAIADSLRSQASSLGQGVENGVTAGNLLDTIDTALTKYKDDLDTMRGKATQAANDATTPANRLSLQADINGLLKKLDGVAKTTQFNGIKLLSGTFADKEFQLGANANDSVKFSIGSVETAKVGQTSRAQMDINKLGENNLKLTNSSTGQIINLASINLQSNNNAANGMGAVAKEINKYSDQTGVTANAVVTSTSSIITAGTTGADFAINGVNIGAVVVSANDSDQTLMKAINDKLSSTGVSATQTTDGRLILTSKEDARAISVTGDMSGITTSTNSDLSTFGHLDVVQSGAAPFQISGANLGAAVGADITLSARATSIQDSILGVGTVLSSTTVIAAGSTLGMIFSATATAAMVINSSTNDTKLAVGSILTSGTILSKGTVLGMKMQTSGSAAISLSSDMLVKAGSVLASGTVFEAGTVLNQDMTISATTYKAGTTLAVDLTLTSGTITLAKDMSMHVDANITNRQAALGGGSTLVAGTVLGADLTNALSSTVQTTMVLKSGSVVGLHSQIAVGTVLGDKLDLSAVGYTTTASMALKVGSILGSGTTVTEGSTLGGEVRINAVTALNQDTLVKAGSILATGTILKAGTILTQDLTDAQIGGGAGSGLKSGTVLGTDIATTNKIYLDQDMTLLKGGTDGLGVGTLGIHSTLAANAGNQNSVNMTNATFDNLSKIDVTTVAGAMKALDTLDSALKDISNMQSNVATTTNQVASTVTNNRATVINLNAAESSIRDVDFAAESAKLAKYTILAQAGTYAMSQANAAQQNVMRLLQ